MGGFLFNGCGAKDYFTKVKPLGSFNCPNCKKVAQFYLEKGNLKVAVLWIPTVSIKERYAIMCEKCEQGKWIDDETAYKILNGAKFDLDSGVEAEKTEEVNPAVVSSAKCPKCNSEIEGSFCGVCGFNKNASAPAASNKEITVAKRLCPKCKTEVKSEFCTACGTKVEEIVQTNKTPLKKCSNCGAEVEGDFCGICGTRYAASVEAPVTPMEKPAQKVEVKVEAKAEVKAEANEWECYLCGTINPKDASKCSLCGCEKDGI